MTHREHHNPSLWLQVRPWLCENFSIRAKITIVPQINPHQRTLWHFYFARDHERKQGKYTTERPNYYRNVGRTSTLASLFKARGVAEHIGCNTRLFSWHSTKRMETARDRHSRRSHSLLRGGSSRSRNIPSESASQFMSSPIIRHGHGLSADDRTIVSEKSLRPS